MNEALKKLTEKEKKIFLEMSDYDKFHSLEVYKKIKKTELKNNEKMEQYKNIADTAKQDEKKKFYIFLVYIVIIFLVSIVPAYLTYIQIGNETYLEFLQSLL